MKIRPDPEHFVFGPNNQYSFIGAFNAAGLPFAVVPCKYAIAFELYFRQNKDFDAIETKFKLVSGKNIIYRLVHITN